MSYPYQIQLDMFYPLPEEEPILPLPAKIALAEAMFLDSLQHLQILQNLFPSYYSIFNRFLIWLQLERIDYNILFQDLFQTIDILIELRDHPISYLQIELIDLIYSTDLGTIGKALKHQNQSLLKKDYIQIQLDITGKQQLLEYRLDLQILRNQRRACIHAASSIIGTRKIQSWGWSCSE